MVSDKGHLEWKKMYFKLSRCYPHREQYSDTLHFCTHCHILFWKVVFHFLFFLFTLAWSECETSNLKLHFIVQHENFKSSVFNLDSKTLQNRSWSENSLVCPLFTLFHKMLAFYLPAIADALLCYFHVGTNQIWRWSKHPAVEEVLIPLVTSQRVDNCLL